jgi:NADH-quinone oxidoreductase subunit J
MPQEIFFYVFAALITLCSIMVVTARSPVAAAMFLVGDLFLLAGLYAMMDAHFIAAIQILVYAGAIVVLFMFVIMLLNLGPEGRKRLAIPAPELGVLVLTVIGFIAIGIMLAMAQPTGAGGNLTPEAIAQAGGNTYTVGMVLFTKYLWPFELASILILLATIASVVIAKKDKPDGGKAEGKRRIAHGQR